MRSRLFTILVLCLFSSSLFAQTSDFSLKNIQFNEKNLIEINFENRSETKEINPENNISFKFLILTNPDRLVIDIKNAKLANPDYKPSLPFFIKSFRSRVEDNSLRLVFDLTQKISVKNSTFKPNSKQIIAEIIGVKEQEKDLDFFVKKVEEFDVETTKIANPDGSSKYLIKKTPKQFSEAKNKKIPTIVIDAGHGGKDPGTIGIFARTKEKDLTLAYAKELGKHLVNTKNYKVYLTRDTDTFLPLKTRVEKARKKKADLFISLHVNAIDDHNVSGFSIYTLSEKSSDKQAELLAQKENRADILNGVNFNGASPDILKTLIDMSQRESKNSSSRFANTVILSVRKSEIDILQNTHRFAGFAVLTAPDMSSVLIELGYLSNKEEEKLLNSLSYKRKVAASLVKAIDEFFTKNRI
ncbi:MAG: N-acetylmuramoyl-L-alanine amidase [Proteobacteria bacterium]|nr:N-acetylmuramoyl-L-alanine amidase [Pseudomonadota bacterium]